MSENTQNPGDLVDGHVRYAKGAAESAIGDLTGSQPWKDSGEQDMAAGKAALQQIGEQRDKTQGYGKAEEIAGKVAGCEGMKEEGAASQIKSG